MAEEAQGASAGKEPAAGTDQTLKVDGGVIGSQVAVGTKVIQIRADGLSTILFVDSTEAPVTRRTLSAVIPARRNLVALGRERELVRLADAVARREIVQVYGESGSGKTTLLLHAAGRGTLGADTVPRCEGAVLLSARGLPMEELLQEIFLATYEAERMRLPAQGERRRLLAALRILLVVDDLECSEQELNEVIDSLPHSTLVLACSRLTLAGRGCTVGLNGLPLASAQTLFRDALDRELTPEEAAQAKRVWQETGGLPSRLGLIAAFLQEAAEHGIPPEVPPAAGLGLLIPKLLKWLSDEAVELLRALLSAGSAQWGEDLAACLRPDGAQSIHALVRSRLLVRDGSRLRSADGVAEALDAPDRNMVAATAESVAAWLRAATPADVAAETEAVIALTASAIEARLHREAVRLARAAAPRLMLGLRWRAWGRVLELGLESARASKSRKDEAYFTHESAVHAYCVGDFVKAAALLSAAVGLGVRGAEGGSGPGSHPQLRLQRPRRRRLLPLDLDRRRLLATRREQGQFARFAGDRHHRRTAARHRRLAVGAAQDQTHGGAAAHQTRHLLQTGPEDVREDRVHRPRRPVGLGPADILAVDVELDRVRPLVDLLEVVR
ncbi:hypothetical protein A8W25_06940 [Streptomyces sp. ERV7]|nr:hypothetical protein A8W25_06940 [Streptomyces sp. ERV7]